MSDDATLECVSCETTFDPAPNGGFCPDCDTPHPDFEVATDEESEDDGSTGDETDEAAGDADAASADDGTSEGDDSASSDSISYCPDCGTDIDDAVTDGDGDGELDACPDCGRAVSTESYCPDCGTDLGEARAAAAEDDEADDAEADADTDSADEAPDADESDEADGEDADADDEDADADDADDGEADDGADDEADSAPVTLSFGGESYDFDDGDTFGRQDEPWLETLVDESGGSDDVAYISSDHLTFSVDEDGVTVTDTSRNGTALNGEDLDGDEAELEDGDTLTLAERAELTVEL
ncbi:FHA domain-containing protein [Halovivax ruber XH-70]|uniref:FHA domain-containing protein n=1 Tax=Halovivax ruber (strain DSM 18193 / JCM 13892 / XH-70) TaxID=797302 RepID=L0ICE0_HALRX|nr:FHA domain-containing protein [Halovivax ruber]AGB16493.1 FHA domain-containing protein [Halovivax ruber XH-70]